MGEQSACPAGCRVAVMRRGFFLSGAFFLCRRVNLAVSSRSVNILFDLHCGRVPDRLRRWTGVRVGWFVVLLLAILSAHAHEGAHASVHDTVAGIMERMRRTLSADELVALTVPKVEAFLTPPEREVLATGPGSFGLSS